MKTAHGTRWLLAAASIAFSLSAVAVDPVPPVLSEVTSVRVVSKECGKPDKKYWQTEDPEQIRVLLREFELIRANPTGIYAAKIGCSTRVSFYRGKQNITSIHIFPCKALELAPVSRKRYFNFEQGFNHLPRLSGMLDVNTSGHSCK